MTHSSSNLIANTIKNSKLYCHKLKDLSIVTPRNLIILVLFAFSALLLFMAYPIHKEFVNDPNLTYSFCFSEQCLNVVKDRFPTQLAMFKESIRATAIIITFLGLWTGLNTYNLTLSNSILNNHIANFKLFCDYCDIEVKKYDRINKSKINYFKLYDLIYPNSKKGIFDKFDAYYSYLLKIENVISESSSFYEAHNSQRGKKHYDYRRHQYRLIKVLAESGINLEITHRNDFYFIENELLLFIDSLTAAFTDSLTELHKLEKKYT